MLHKLFLLTILAVLAVNCQGFSLFDNDGQDLSSWINQQFNDGIKAFEDSMSKFQNEMQQMRDRMKDLSQAQLRDQNNSLSLVLVSNNSNVVRYNLGGCDCVNYTCACRAHFVLPQLKINNTFGLNLTYLVDEVGLRVTFDIDGRVLYNQSVSAASNPPPICVDAPFLKEAASLCINFYRLDVSKGHLKGCVDLIAKLADVEVARVKIGCFRLSKGSKFYEQNVISISDSNSNPKFINEFTQSAGNNFNVKSLSVLNDDVDWPSISLNISPAKSLFNNFNSLFLERKKRN